MSALDEIRGLSLLPPWGHAMAIDRKRFETRGTRVARPGQRLAIASSARWDDDGRELLADSPRLIDDLAHVYGRGLPLGVVLAVVTVTRVGHVPAPRDAPTKRGWPVVVWDDGGYECVSRGEAALGNYLPGRIVIATGQRVRMLDPVPVRGLPGLYRLDDDVLARILEQLR